ncbi:hypothetical protein D9M71_761410 [compost metagenome]
MGPGMACAGDTDPDLFWCKGDTEIVAKACLQAFAGPCQQVVLLLKLGEVEDTGRRRFFRGQHQLLQGLHDVAQPLDAGLAQPCRQVFLQQQ